MSFSRAEVSPSLAWRRRVSISSWDKTRSLEVFTPQISTFPCIFCPPAYSWAAAGESVQGRFGGSPTTKVFPAQDN